MRFFRDFVIRNSELSIIYLCGNCFFITLVADLERDTSLRLFIFVVPDSRELKCPWPAVIFMALPVLVILMRFAADLFVFSLGILFDVPDYTSRFYIIRQVI